MDIYGIALVVCAVALASITSMRIAFFLAVRWGFSCTENKVCFTILGGVVAAIVMGFIAVAAVKAGGNLYGIISVVGSVPFVGFAWGFIVGSNKAIERILFGLLKKLS